MIPKPTIRSLPIEVKIDIQQYGKYMAFLRRHPTHAVRVLWGIIVPPHESAMLEAAWMGYKENVFVCSRGTSKTFVLGSLFPPTKGLLFRNVDSLVASASRFRGGKKVLQDTSRLIRGNLRNQKKVPKWGAVSLTHYPRVLKKEADMWSMEMYSNSQVYTVPTNIEETVRGLRATTLILDERNTFDGDAIQNVFIPFMIVGTDFDRPAMGANANQVFSIGTIDYTFRDWYKEIVAAQDRAKMEYEANRAMMAQDWELYDSIKKKYGSRLETTSLYYARYDYTDLLIPTTIGDYKINYPGAKPGINTIYDHRDRCEYTYTYPVEKNIIESPLDEGIADSEAWFAEHRNQFIAASGEVFSIDLVERVTGPIFSNQDEVDLKWKKSVKSDERYLPPVLYECADPCILGVDVARTSDFTAFVIIRWGEGDPSSYEYPSYNLTTHSGYSSFSNVIWAEQHQKMTAKETANKIRELRTRYNIIGTRQIQGIYMDARGGGTAVRDELAIPSPDVDEFGGIDPHWVAPEKIFDPEDKDERLGKDLIFAENTWPGLKLLWTQDQFNHESVGFARAHMQANRLYIGSWQPVSLRQDKTEKMHAGYLGVQTLKKQLLRIQAQPTASAFKYIMPGDPNKIENHKDTFFAFIYAAAALKEWTISMENRAAFREPESFGTIIYMGGGL